MPTEFLAALPSDIQQQLSVLEEEDPSFAEAMRVMLWDTYVRSGLPLGHSEHGMHAWWAFGQGTTVQ